MIGQYVYKKKLGKGMSSEVFLAEKNGEKFALKLMSLKYTKIFKNEIFICQKLNHPNIVKYIEHFENLEIVDSNKKVLKVNCIVFEYLPGGELFDYISLHNNEEIDYKDNQKILRQILCGLQYIHSQGFCHLDIKPENIFLDADNNIKIGDFGFAIDLKHHYNGQLSKFHGTKGYMSPEISEKILFDGFQSDIFSFGIILFILYVRRMPFIQAVISDIWYKHIIMHQYQEFWSSHMYKPKNNIDVDFQQLFMLVCAYNPVQRPGLVDVIGHCLIQNEIIDISIQNQKKKSISNLFPIIHQQPVKQQNQLNRGLELQDNIQLSALQLYHTD